MPTVTISPCGKTCSYTWVWLEWIERQFKGGEEETQYRFPASPKGEAEQKDALDKYVSEHPFYQGGGASAKPPQHLDNIFSPDTQPSDLLGWIGNYVHHPKSLGVIGSYDPETPFYHEGAQNEKEVNP